MTTTGTPEPRSTMFMNFGSRIPNPESRQFRSGFPVFSVCWMRSCVLRSADETEKRLALEVEQLLLGDR